MPITAMGQNLVLPEEIEKKALVLYRKDGDELSFAGLYDPDVPDEDYRDEIVAVPFRSTFLRVDRFPAKTKVWNVQQSSDDNVFVDTNHLLGNITNASWLDIWSIVTGKKFPVRCYVHGVGTNVTTNIVGGHMMLTQSAVLAPGSDVYLLPICSQHNHYTNVNVMEVDTNVDVVVMRYKM